MEALMFSKSITRILPILGLSIFILIAGSEKLVGQVIPPTQNQHHPSFKLPSFFQAQLKENETEQIKVEFNQQLSYSKIATMLSMHAKSDDGNCNVFLLNVKNQLETGKYFTDDEEGKAAVVCFLKHADVMERIVSESGHLLIKEINRQGTMTGTIEMQLFGHKPA
jgi:hypothetical protein